MLLKIILIISTLSGIFVSSEATHIAELNGTILINAVNLQLAKFSEELQRQGKLLESVVIQKTQRAESTTVGSHCAPLSSSGIQHLLIPGYSSVPFAVSCEGNVRGGGWTIILRRMDGSVHFGRSWRIYRQGFGDLGGEFFLGLEKIHALTADRSQELLVLLEDFEGNVTEEFYSKFAIGDDLESYRLHTLGPAKGTAGDSLRRHHGMKFSTYDRDNDLDAKRHCAKEYNAAWWYNNCHDSNLAGIYKDNSTGKGINWRSFRGVNYSLKQAIMMIRPRK